LKDGNLTPIGAYLSLHHCDIFKGMDDYDIQWGELKKRKKLALFAFFGYVPITFAFGLLMHPLLQTDKPVFVFAIAWMLFFAVALARYSSFRCPRCGKRFFSTWW